MENLFRICNQVSIFTWKQLHGRNELQRRAGYCTINKKGRHPTAFLSSFQNPERAQKNLAWHLQKALNIAVVRQRIVMPAHNAAVFGAHQFQADKSEIGCCRIGAYEHQ